MINEVIAYLIEKKITVSTAESCTAGMIAAKLGDVSGVSQIFSQGFVTYSNDAKEKLLGVSCELLKKHGAVSEQVARAMAEGAAKTSGAMLGLSSTGIAGPTGGTAEKPVGLVYMGICYNGETTVIKRIFTGDRGEVRSQTVEEIFAQVKKILQI